MIYDGKSLCLRGHRKFLLFRRMLFRNRSNRRLEFSSRLFIPLAEQLIGLLFADLFNRRQIRVGNNRSFIEYLLELGKLLWCRLHMIYKN
ncbi:hypothetical protein D3C71_2002560 [compost metagenome]